MFHPRGVDYKQARQKPNSYQFNITGTDIIGAGGLVIVVEASTSLANPLWTPMQTITLTGASFYFSDAQWANYPARFYRLRSP